MDAERWVNVWVTSSSGLRDMHVVPIGDLIKHTYTSTCLCEPRIEQYPSGSLCIVHMAWDDRHVAERMN